MISCQYGLIYTFHTDYLSNEWLFKNNPYNTNAVQCISNCSAVVLFVGVKCIFIGHESGGFKSILFEMT